MPNLVKLGEQVAVDIRACSAVVQSKALESKVKLSMQKCSKIDPVVVIHLPQKAPNGHRNKITSQHGDSKSLALNPKP